MSDLFTVDTIVLHLSAVGLVGSFLLAYASSIAFMYRA
jgi:hypothetical protein